MTKYKRKIFKEMEKSDKLNILGPGWNLGFGQLLVLT